MDSPIDISRDGDVLVITLNDPATRNAMSRVVSSAALTAMDNASTDPSIGAVIFRGAEGNFCSGGNINNFKTRPTLTQAERYASIHAFHGWIKAMRNCPKPVIAAVEGNAAGAGFSIAMACDLVVASEDAKFTLAYVKIGLTPDGGSTSFLGRNFPRQLAAEMLMNGSRIDAQRLYSLGLINRLVPQGTADAEALDWAKQLAAGPRRALAKGKDLLNRGAENPLAAQLDLEAVNIEACFDHAEGQEGVRAFLEKRRPDFSQFHSHAEAAD